MRDLGMMGESTFSLWCAESGLIANGSKIDKTGWDFFVEFPFNFNADVNEIHKSAIECKVQIKATDGNKGKIAISLSNLRRLATVPMPSFFVFLEFDGKSTAQRAYIVHVDNNLISKVLKRLHEIEQREFESKFNQRTITIHYNDSHIMSELDGETLRNQFLSYIGNDMTKYIDNKKKHLESTGYENSYAKINFTAVGEQNVRKLIDMSLGLEECVEITHFKGVKARFGIESRSPFCEGVEGRLEMPGLQAYTLGKIRFKEDRLSAGYSFPAKLYISPFNSMIPNNLVKARIEGDFFDLKFYPFTGETESSFSFGEGLRLEIHQFRGALRLLKDLCTPGKLLCAEMLFENFPHIDFNVECHGLEFPFSKELKALDLACSILSYFNVTDDVDASLVEISSVSESICQFDYLINCSEKNFKVEFNVEDKTYNPLKKTACICLISTQIGSHSFGVLFVITGEVIINTEKNKYELYSTARNIEKKICSQRDCPINREDILAVIGPIEQRYSKDYQVVILEK